MIKALTDKYDKEQEEKQLKKGEYNKKYQTLS